MTQTVCEQPPSGSGLTLGSALRLVSGITLLSRILGLVRDLITARIFGDTAVGSAFAAAFAVPNTFRRLFGEGALAAAFIPEYAGLVDRDPALAGRFATLTVGALAVVTGALTIALELAVWGLLLALPEMGQRSLSLRLVMVTLPFMPLICVAATLGGMLQTHGRFGPPAAQPIVLNGLIIGACAVAIALGMAPQPAAYLIGGATVLAGAVQICWSVVALRGLVQWSRAGAGAAEPARRMLGRFLPALIGLGALQLNTLVDTLIAMWPIWIGPSMLGRPVPLDEASQAILFYTQRLYQFPLGVFGIAVATVVFPALSRQATDGARFVETLRRGMRLSLFIGLPASTGLMLVAPDAVATLYSGGEHSFSADGVARAGGALIGYSAAVWAYSLNHTLTRAFYARGDARTPMRVALGALLLAIILDLVLIWPLREAGLAWATAAGAMAQLLALVILASRVTGAALPDRQTLGATARIAGAVIIMSAGVLGAGVLAPEQPGWSGHAVRLGLQIGAGAAAYFLGAWALGCRELRWLLGRRAADSA
ncbi:MAG: murein biosynthesis integral membrane protein MurJ [Phycisphaerales bacterium JB039]